MLSYLITHYEVFFLVLLRVVAFVGASPIVSIQSWPVWAKLGLSVFVSMLIAPTVVTKIPDAMSQPGLYILTAILETATGLLLGFIATMIFSVITIAGQLVDIQIGFSSATLFSPGSSQPTGLSASFYSALFSLFFLGMNGLDGLLLSIMSSYHFVAMGHFRLPAGSWQLMTSLFGVIMSMGVEMVAPLLTALLLTDMTFAFVSRAVPQMNIYSVGMPGKLLVGLTMYIVGMPGVIYGFNRVFTLLFSQLQGVLQFLGG
jgi:flagellar biosynthesis protein FliR